MAVDLFEEIVRSAFQADGYLTMENVCYRRHANAKDVVGVAGAEQVASDIDLLAIAPMRIGPRRVLAISCKGGRHGIHLPNACDSIIAGSKSSVAGSSAASGFRELTQQSWQAAFRHAVYSVTGFTIFTHVTVAKRVDGDRRIWQDQPIFKMLTPYLLLYDMADLLRMIEKREHRLFANGTALKLRDLMLPGRAPSLPPDRRTLRLVRLVPTPPHRCNARTTAPPP